MRTDENLTDVGAILLTITSSERANTFVFSSYFLSPFLLLSLVNLSCRMCPIPKKSKHTARIRNARWPNVGRGKQRKVCFNLLSFHSDFTEQISAGRRKSQSAPTRNKSVDNAKQ